MAEEFDSVANPPEDGATGLTRRSRTRKAPSRRRGGRAVAAAPAGGPAPSGHKKDLKPVRSVVILSMVAGLIATVALPAYAAWRPEEQAVTLQQVAADDAQSLVVASDVTATGLERNSYSATTAEEIEKKKAQEAAAERARSLTTAVQSNSSVTSVDLSMTAPGSGEVRWPLAGGYTLGDGFRSRGGAHMGIDMLAAGGTPIFAAAAGVVRVSQESFGGYGVAVTIDHVINGQRVSTLYGHMIYGSRQVSAGQTVEAGQLIGLVGSTGRSTANHLHFETFINGQNVDPLGWLQSNAG